MGKNFDDEVNLETTEAVLSVLRIARNKIEEHGIEKIGSHYADAVEAVIRPIIEELVELRFRER